MQVLVHSGKLLKFKKNKLPMDLKQLHKTQLFFFSFAHMHKPMRLFTLKHLSGNLLKLSLTPQKNYTVFSKSFDHLGYFFSPVGTSLFHRKCVFVRVSIFCTNTINKPCLYIQTRFKRLYNNFYSSSRKVPKKSSSTK
jgi:hypothetical protein